MKWYADNSAMRTRQQLSDLAVLAFCWLFM